MVNGMFSAPPKMILFSSRGNSAGHAQLIMQPHLPGEYGSKSLKVPAIGVLAMHVVYWHGSLGCLMHVLPLLATLLLFKLPVTDLLVLLLSQPPLSIPAFPAMRAFLHQVAGT